MDILFPELTQEYLNGQKRLEIILDTLLTAEETQEKSITADKAKEFSQKLATESMIAALEVN